MRITTQYHGEFLPPLRWSAIDEQTYDGAEDSVFPFTAMGWGRTEVAAIQDLMAQFERDDNETPILGEVQQVAPDRKELPVNPEQTPVNLCPSCQRQFRDGDTCPRGGCPMGGDF